MLENLLEFHKFNHFCFILFLLKLFTENDQLLANQKTEPFVVY